MPERPEFEDLYREFLPRIYGYALAQLRNAAEAEDVTAQVFIKAYQAYDRFEPRAATPAAWLFQIARNAILHFHRPAGVRERTVQAAGRARGRASMTRAGNSSRPSGRGRGGCSTGCWSPPTWRRRWRRWWRSPGSAGWRPASTREAARRPPAAGRLPTGPRPGSACSRP